MKCNKPHAFSRRQALSMLGWGSAFYMFRNPFEMLASGIVDGIISNAQAQSGLGPRNFVSVLIPGAPPQWLWNFLRPNGPTDSFISNLSMVNYLTENSYTGDSSKTSYVVEPVNIGGGKTIYLPPIWNRFIPYGNSGSVMMNTLLDNMIFIRGVDMLIDVGHEVGVVKLQAPLIDGPSLSGQVADYSKAPIPAVGLARYPYSTNYGRADIGAYRSAHGTGISLVTNTNDGLNKLLSPFIHSSSIPTADLNKLKSSAIQSAISNAMAELGEFAKSGRPGADAVNNSRANAEALFNKAFSSLGSEFTTLADKYKKNEERCAKESIANILPSATTVSGYNINSNSYDTELAQQFAIVEYLIKNNLSSSMTLSCGGPALAGIYNGNDEHFQSDRQRSVICHSYLFRVIASHIHTLRTSLGDTLWERTVVEVGSEFDRSPRDTIADLGSDHAAASNSIAIFSGAIKQPLFIGNIKVNGSIDPVYKGTWGAAAPVTGNFGNAVINPEYVASTVAHLLQVPSPSNRPSLVTETSSGVVSNVEDPKNVG